MSKIEELIQEKCLDGVEYKILADVYEYRRGSFPQPYTEPSFYGGDNAMPFVQVADICDEGFRLNETTNQTISEIAQPKSVFVPSGTVIVSLQGTIGRVAITQYDAYVDRTVAIFTKPKLEDLDSKFFAYVLKQKFDYAKQFARGSTIKTITKEEFSRFEIPVPPIEVQQQIVRILDKFTELETELQAELDARKKQYEYYRDKLMDNVEGRSGKLIEMLCQPVTDGPHTTPKLVPEGIPFISATAIHEGRIHFEDAQGFITKEFDDECAKKYKPKRDDVYMVKSGSTTGKVGYVDTDVDFNIWSPLAAMRVNSENSARYLFHLLHTQSVQFQVSTRMSHGSQPNLSMRVLEQFDVIIPTLQEQTRIVNILEKYDALCNDNENGLPAEIEARRKQYEYYRDKLLTFERKGV